MHIIDEIKYLRKKLELVPSGKGINNCKIELKENSAIFHFRMEGKLYTQKTDFT
jgi:hypothetical protein